MHNIQMLLTKADWPYENIIFFFGDKPNDFIWAHWACAMWQLYPTIHTKVLLT